MYISNLSIKELFKFATPLINKQFGKCDVNILGAFNGRDCKFVTFELKQDGETKCEVKVRFTDYNCQIVDLNQARQNTYNKDYATWMYGLLKSKEALGNAQLSSEQYKKDYNAYRNAIKQQIIEQQIKQIEEECEQTLLK